MPSLLNITKSILYPLRPFGIVRQGTNLTAMHDKWAMFLNLGRTQPSQGDTTKYDLIDTVFQPCKSENLSAARNKTKSRDISVYQNMTTECRQNTQIMATWVEITRL